MMIPFEAYLQDHCVLFDGAMGTYIYQQGVFIDKCYDELNLSNPDLIRKIHREYRDAGAMVVETNTYGANRIKLQKHNLSSRLKEINCQGARLAREIMGEKGYVAGSIGPLGVRIAPWGELPLEEIGEIFFEQAKALLDGGVDLFILETFHDIREIEQAAKSISELGKPVIASMTIQEDGKTKYGLDVEEIASRLSQLPVSAIGLNCTVGPKPMLDFLERMIKCTNKPISIMPNAGYPQLIDGRMFYMSTPEYFCVYTKRFIEIGARIVGGCCGTTPEHIRKMKEAIAQKETRHGLRIQIHEIPSIQLVLKEELPVEKKSELARKIVQKEFVRIVEMVPPRGRDISKQLSSAEILKASGIHAINIPDGPRASARLNGMVLAAMLQSKVGIEAVLHIACRDHSLLGLQSFLLGAAVLGIKNILAITGDPPMLGDYPQSTAVFDINSIGLVHMVRYLNRGVDIGNKSIGEPTGFFVGVGVDPNSVNPERELQRYFQKVDAGAEFAITQPVFDLTPLDAFLEKIQAKPIPIIAGIWPLVSYRNAEFMRNEVPGVVIPDAVMERIGSFESKEDQLKVGIEIAKEMLEKVRSRVQGVQISAPFGRYEIAIEIAGIL